MHKFGTDTMMQFKTSHCLFQDHEQQQEAPYLYRPRDCPLLRSQHSQVHGGDLDQE